MTGFASAQGLDEGCSWTWELKSVNGKGLDVRCRLASGFDHLEQTVRERIKGRLERGNVNASLTLDGSRSEGAYRVNQEVLDQYLSFLPKIQDSVPGAAPPSADGLLALRGVIEAVDGGHSEEVMEKLGKAFVAGLDGALDSLVSMRAEEGQRLSGTLHSQLEDMARLISAIGEVAALQPAAIKKRLKTQVEELLEAVPALPEERLAQEAAVLMVKADIGEELDRLKAHVSAAKALLSEDGAVGRKFDFLCQEFNREANTLCAKSPDVEMTRLGLDLKSVIDKLREQVQNIE